MHGHDPYKGVSKSKAKIYSNHFRAALTLEYTSKGSTHTIFNGLKVPLVHQLASSPARGWPVELSGVWCHRTQKRVGSCCESSLCLQKQTIKPADMHYMQTTRDSCRRFWSEKKKKHIYIYIYIYIIAGQLGHDHGKWTPALCFLSS